jgi:acetyl esterase/lipase
MNKKPADIKMDNIDYQHEVPLSFEARLIGITMSLIGLKKRLEQRMVSNNFEIEPAKPSKSLLRSFAIQESEQNGRKVWRVYPRESKTDLVILFLHGGAYMANITKLHWNLINKLLQETNAIIVAPDYPLTPASSCRETYDFIETLYTGLRAEFPSKRIIFIGDSAGGGLALGFAQQLRNGKQKQPDQIVLLSPWLDVTMSNPDTGLTDKADKILSIEGLRSAGQKYAGDLDMRDYRVSPIYGDLTGLCRISIFTGTADLLNADARKCREQMRKLMKDHQNQFNYFEYPKMFHDWVIMTRLKESRDVIIKIRQLVNMQNLTSQKFL